MSECAHCQEKKRNEMMGKRTACEVYSRVTGYLRPVKQWNDGKRAEYMDRKAFRIKEEAEKAVEMPIEANVNINNQ